MLKKAVTYEDFNGKEVTEEFHFHLSQVELAEMEASTSGGLAKHLQHIADTDDGAAIISEFKRILTMSIGKVSEDGRRFVKNDAIRDDFMESPAFPKLFMELATDAGLAAEFINGMIPKSLAEDVAKVSPAQPEPQREKAAAESTPVRHSDKVMTRAEAVALPQEALARRIADGWTIDANMP